MPLRTKCLALCLCALASFAVAADEPQQQSAANSTAAANATMLPDCADTQVPVRQLDLAASAPVIVTGITLAAGPGAGRCNTTNGNLNIALDNSTEPQTNFIVLGIQCVHKGLVSCRNNEEDTKDCLILVAAPTMKDSIPCSIMQGERYQFYLQEKPYGCPGYYLTMYEHIYHSVRRPLGGTGCTFYPTFPDPQELQQKLTATCTQPATCTQNMCDPTISKSPCANDTSCACTMKTCPGKWMYHNAILPEDTCYEVYNYVTSGIPTNCYGRRYINNRIRQLAAHDPGLLGNLTDTNSTSPGSNSTLDTSVVGGDALNRTNLGQQPQAGVLQGADGMPGTNDAAEVFTTTTAANQTATQQDSSSTDVSGGDGELAGDASGPSDETDTNDPANDPMGTLAQIVQPLQQPPN